MPWARRDLFKGLYSGFLLPLVCNAPAGGVFFATKDTVKEMLAEEGVPSPWLQVCKVIDCVS
jgi:hypothetical protein